MPLSTINSGIARDLFSEMTKARNDVGGRQCQQQMWAVNNGISYPVGNIWKRIKVNCPCLKINSAELEFGSDVKSIVVGMRLQVNDWVYRFQTWYDSRGYDFDFYQDDENILYLFTWIEQKGCKKEHRLRDLGQMNYLIFTTTNTFQNAVAHW